MRKKTISSSKKNTPPKISQSKCTIKSTKRSQPPLPKSHSKTKYVQPSINNANTNSNKSKSKQKQKQKSKQNKKYRQCGCQIKQNISRYSEIDNRESSIKKEDKSFRSVKKNSHIRIQDRGQGRQEARDQESQDSIEYVIQSNEEEEKSGKKRKRSEVSARKLNSKQNSKYSLREQDKATKIDHNFKRKLQSKQNISSKLKQRKGSQDTINELSHSNIQKYIGRQKLTFFLDNYDRTLDQRIKILKSKWQQLQILQKSIQGIQTPHHLDQPNHKSDYPSTLVIQNEYYVQKITDLQSQLKKKQNQLKQIRTKHDVEIDVDEKEKLRENKRLREENSLLQRQNKVLKGKLKELGFL